MGAEQSAVLACTQTGIQEKPLELINSELFFRLYFEKMRQPVTGPVTEALLHLVNNLQSSRAIVNAEESNQEEDNCSESGFNSEYSDDSEVSTATYSDDVEIEPLQIAQFDSMDEYDVPLYDSNEPFVDTLPLFNSH
ncbi:uncharacterized protein [Drosophila takahashii]|uniref:uncharacterized protein n=1 Tax=Drosophila takahashii TaxID=29030 RepID=UPI001CF7F725|nr:uncharacterized protein LOC108061298 [Drosophila takahashii]